MHRIDSVQGRMLSKEMIVHCAERSRAGIDRVVQSVREIEADMLDGMAEPTARVLCFSRRATSGRCSPTRGPRRVDEQPLHVIELADSGGKRGFSYSGFGSGNGFTLGTGTLHEVLARTRASATSGRSPRT